MSSHEDCSNIILNDDEKVCRTCLHTSKSYNEIKIKDNDEYIISMLTMCLPQINLTLTKDPIICQNCISKLEEFHKFLIVCLEIEEKLTNYCGSWNVNVPIDLANILNITVKENDDICVKYEDQQIREVGIKIENDLPKLSEQIHLQNNSEHEEKKEVYDFNNTFTRDIKSETFQCHTCNALFSTKCLLDKHIPTHNVPCIFTCNICNSEFKYKHSFEKHFQAHVNDRQAAKPFSCDICGKLFDRKAKMRKHQEIHIVKEKPFICNICGKRFINEELLKSHRHRVHDSEKAFNCELCGNKYARNIHWKNTE
ncbi:uncharacterized protein LOC143193067 isoform X2 [Rhynchophorus ferrugineus]|uniref:C2H2-type domain-containing protein n=1 Tax=Rhynchophorus ferrugineus TaxID=354439 RepID=A0A834J097_RHYFE|nr:hypothetical protein GWI33_022657 [Rhynchophorus ferrugineus]